MCRFVAYLGPPIALDALTTLPSHSIVKQSYQARERTEPLNGDGFGVAWYAPTRDERPARYRAVTPAWNDENLLSLARVVESGCVFAHVRAATPGLGVSQFNCHPFIDGSYAFMHNGHIKELALLKRRLMHELDDERWRSIRGTTDSEVLFALFRQLVEGSDASGAERLLDGLRATIARLSEISREAGVDGPHLLNLAVTDGVHLAVTRYSTGDPEGAESLYMHEGRRYVCEVDVCRMIDPDEAGGAVIVASERLSDDEGWVHIPGNHAVVVDKDRDVVMRSL
jgi:ergothioneine biosynthesis protein EgtC